MRLLPLRLNRTSALHYRIPVAMGRERHSGSKVLRLFLVLFVILDAVLAVWLWYPSLVRLDPSNGPGNPTLTTVASQLKPDTLSPFGSENWRPATVATPTLPLGDKIAMIVETQMLDNLVPLILHFTMVLGPSWQVVLFISKNEWKTPDSIHFQRAKEAGHVIIRFLPLGTDLADRGTVSWFMTRPWLWEQVQSASRVLLFQTDSIICTNSNWAADDFLEWDFIGAPLDPARNQEGYNGEFSLRNPKLILEILANSGHDFDEKWAANRSDLYVEDRWFYQQMKQLPHAKLPSIDIAKQFSTQTIWNDRPLGFHKPRVWNSKHMGEIQKYCPEVGLINDGNLPIETAVA